MLAILSILSIISFVLSIFIWVYDSEEEKFPEKITLPAIGLTGILVIICLLFIAPPDTFTYTDIQLLIILFFVVTFAFLTIAEEEKLRVILFGAALSIMILIIFLNQLFPLEYLRGLTHNQLEALTIEQLTEEFGRRLPLALEQLIEIAENPTLFFEVVIFSSFIEWEVISIVFGMSLLVGVLSVTGLFDMVSIRITKASGGTPKKLLGLVFFLTLILSALLDNTTAIILLSGITITVTRGLDLNPIPYILAEVAATIMAGIITVIGSLPGILIASPNSGNIPFITFFLVNSLFIVVAVAISLFYLLTIFKQDLMVSEDTSSYIDHDALNLLDEWSVVDSRRNLYLGSIVLGAVVVGLVLSSSIGVSVGFIAIAGAIIAIIITKVDMQTVIHEIEMNSILFFIGLFVLVGTLQVTGILGSSCRNHASHVRRRSSYSGYFNNNGHLCSECCCCKHPYHNCLGRGYQNFTRRSRIC